jgi:hypothetical protein
MKGEGCDVAGRHDYVGYPIRQLPLGLGMEIVPFFRKNYISEMINA